jgi:hypothetical protein
MLAQIADEFFQKHQNDLNFAIESAEGRFSRKTINRFAGFYLKRDLEFSKDPEYAEGRKPSAEWGRGKSTTSA